jgi:hypothetical protein
LQKYEGNLGKVAATSIGQRESWCASCEQDIENDCPRKGKEATTIPKAAETAAAAGASFLSSIA